jgi:hypothetical protein
MNVTFVQAVCAKSGPTIALPNNKIRASAPTAVRPGWAICGFQPLRHEFHQSLDRAALSGFQPNDRPITITPRSAAVFANVNVFWTSLPVSRPRVFVQLSSRIKAIATSCSDERLIAYPPKTIGLMR